MRPPVRCSRMAVLQATRPHAGRERRDQPQTEPSLNMSPAGAPQGIPERRGTHHWNLDLERLTQVPTGRGVATVVRPRITVVDLGPAGSPPLRN